MSDVQEMEIGDGSHKRALRANSVWKIGETFPIHYMPSVEGMVVATRWIDEVFMVVFLSPPFKKEGGTWAEAALVYKKAIAVVHEPLSGYEFPFPKDKRILQEVTRANGNVHMLKEVINLMNKTYPPPSYTNVERLPEPALNPWGVEDVEAVAPPPSNEDRLSVHLLLSQQGELPQEDHAHLPPPVMEKIMKEVSHRFSLSDNGHKQSRHSRRNAVQSISSSASKQHKEKSKKKNKKESTSSSSSQSSSSSSSSSDSSSSESEVGNLEGDTGKGWIKCPFSYTDTRLMPDPREEIRSTSSERFMLRKALQNLYNHYTTLSWFVETIKVDSVPSPTRPYNSDITWLRYHASYLDQLFLQPLAGPWRSWDELIVDQLVRSFLELVVRASSERKYPDILDEKVRKWMKKRRVGLTSSFGSIPAFLADAKITDAGIQPKGGWEALRKRDSRNSNFSSTSTRNKTTPAAASSGEKKV